MDSTEDHLLVYSDYVCPFCYLGRVSVSTYRESRDGDLAIEWHPFDLRSRKRGPDGEIDHSADDGKDEAYFDQVRENVERLRKEYGADDMLGIDDVPDVDSLPAQVASASVQREHPDSWLDFDWRIFEALWIEGRDIGDVDVLADCATAVGISADEIRDAVGDEDRRERIFEQFGDAHDRGVTGVPTFVYDGHSARGAVPPGQLKRLVEGT
ncbi:MAG: DsbA family oxidoreductase [Natronomonas sp.]